MAPLMVLIGNPGSGAQNAPELVAEPWRTLGSALPPGAGTDLLRGVAYFDGAQVGPPLLILGAWALAGLVMLAIPRRKPAAAGPAEPDEKRGDQSLPAALSAR